MVTTSLAKPKTDFQYFKEISNAVMNLLVSRTFYGIFLNTLNKVLVDERHHVKGLGIEMEGLNFRLIVNRRLWDAMSTAERESVLAHEADHIMLDHLPLMKEYPDPGTANQAMDLYINHFLRKDKYFGNTCLPGSSISSKDWKDNYVPKLVKLQKDLEAKTITEEKYWVEFRKIPFRGIFLEDFPDFDAHDVERGTDFIYNKMEKIKKMEKGEGGASSSSCSSIVKELLDNNVPHPSAHQEWNALKKMDKIKKRLVSNQVKHIIKQVAEETIKSQGDIPHHLKNVVDNLLNPPKPITNWRAIFANWFGGFGTSNIIKRSFMRPSLVIPDMPRIKIKHGKHMAFLQDTSASVSDKETIEIYQESLNVKKTTECTITIIECDAFVDPERGVYELENINQVKKRMEDGLVTGGGGTSIDPGIDYVMTRKDFTAVIYFTDGHLSKPKRLPLIPMMVVLTSRGKEPDDMTNWGVPILKIPSNYASR